jgi:hypothetical protein
MTCRNDQGSTARSDRPTKQGPNVPANSLPVCIRTDPTTEAPTADQALDTGGLICLYGLTIRLNS